MRGLADHSRYSRQKLEPLFGRDFAHAENMRLGSEMLRDAMLREFAAMRRRRIG